MRLHPYGVATGLVLIAALPVSGQPSNPSAKTQSTLGQTHTVDEEITVTADRLEVPTDAVGSSVTVIGRQEIERRRKETVAELLRTVPGVEINRTSGAGSITSAFIRGGSSAFTLVLLDGVRLNSPAGGGFDFSQLLTDNIERIEIVRGPQSTLYGSEAIGGVISITTRRGDGPLAVSAYGEAGSFDSSRFGASIRGGGPRFDYSFSATATDTDGVSSAAERFGNDEEDGSENQTISARLGWALGAEGRVDVSLRSIDADTEIDAFGFDLERGFVPVDDPNAVQSVDSTIARVDVEFPISKRITQSIRAGIQDEDLEAKDPDSPFNNFASNVMRFEIEGQTAIEMSPNGTLIAGFEHESRDAESPGNFDQSTDITSLFAQHRWAVERGAVTVGVRHDDHETFGGETTWRVTGTWSLQQSASRRTRLHATVGTGFRAPSLNELFFPFFGNVDLAPETSTGFDLGLEQRWLNGRLTFDLTYFDNDFEDLIGVSPAFTAINIDQAEAKGFELVATFRPDSRWFLEGSHTVTDTEDERTGQALARRPEHRSTVRFGFEPSDRFDGELSVISVRDRIDTDGGAMDDYERFDLAFGIDLMRGFSTYLRAENLLDEDYEEVNGFTTPGLALRVGLRWGQ